MKRAKVYHRVHPGCRNPWHVSTLETGGVWLTWTALKPAPTWHAAMETALAAVGLATPPEHREAP